MKDLIDELQDTYIDLGVRDDGDTTVAVDDADSKVDEIYRGLETAETASVNRKHYDEEDGKYWKRTLAPEEGSKGSSAFGPLQITKTLFNDVFHRKDKFNITPEEEEYLVFFIVQGNQFLKHGNNEGKIEDYDSNFDYSRKKGGGSGYFGNDKVMESLGGKSKVKEMYKSIAKKIIKEKLNESSGDVDKVIESWRGKRDKAYWKRYASSNNKSRTKTKV